MASAPVRESDDAEVVDELAAVAQRRDTAAFAAIFRRYAPRVKSYMFRAGATVGEAEELAQETLVQVWRRAETYDAARATPAAWIFAIARNLRIDALRRRGRNSPDMIEELKALNSDLATPELIYDLEEQERRVSVAMVELSPEHHEVLRMSYFDGLSQTEIASRLDLPLGTVKSRVRLAIARLRKLLGDAD